MASMRRARAVLKIKRKKTVSVTGKANAICNGLTNNAALIPTPNPSVASILAQVAVVNKAETLAKTKATGAAAARDVQRNILVGMMETELNTVQGVADTCAGLDQAIAVIQAGGLDVALVGQYTKPILAVTQATPGGPVTLNANATALTGRSQKGRFFNWQSTADGKTFVTLPSTPKVKTTVANLTPLSTYGFRVCVTNSDGTMGEWTQVISFLVH
jgi:hypothetical protein